MGFGRATAYRTSGPRPLFYQRRDDRLVTAQIRMVIRTRGSYGSRRVRALVNHLFGTVYNRKRIRCFTVYCHDRHAVKYQRR